MTNNQTQKLSEICDNAVEIVSGCPIYFCRANYECKYLMQVFEFQEKKYCLRRLKELEQMKNDAEALEVKEII